ARKTYSILRRKRAAKSRSAGERLIRCGWTLPRCEWSAVRAAALFENLQFLQPSHKGMCRGVRPFSALRVLNPVQDFIALVDSGSSLLFARKAHRVVEVADDPTILEMQFRREIKLSRHAAETPGCVGGSPKIARGVMMGLRELRAKF